jgi:hypothetical protein
VTNKPSNRFNSAAKGQVQAPDVSGLIHARHRPQPVGKVPPLRDDAFEPELACVREDDRAVAVEMLGESNAVAVREQLIPAMNHYDRDAL